MPIVAIFAPPASVPRLTHSCVLANSSFSGFTRNSLYDFRRRNGSNQRTLPWSLAAIERQRHDPGRLWTAADVDRQLAAGRRTGARDIAHCDRSVERGREGAAGRLPHNLTLVENIEAFARDALAGE